MRKIVFLWMALMIVSIHAFADGKVSFTASAPDAVAVGDQFRLSYTVTTQKVRDFRTPSIKGFDVLMGPSRSQQKSVQIINGETTSTSSITFTYILMATAEGSFTIPGATITAEGNQIGFQFCTHKCTSCRPSGRGSFRKWWKTKRFDKPCFIRNVSFK